jgi:hypothetical protein
MNLVLEIEVIQILIVLGYKFHRAGADSCCDDMPIFAG